MKWGGIFVTEYVSVEIVSALTRRYRDGKLKGAPEDAFAEFYQDYGDSFDILHLAAFNFANDAIALLLNYRAHGLQPGDAIHLAGAEYLISTGRSIILVASDKPLLRVATLEDVTVYDPAEEGLSRLEELAGG